jgi:hypothetical protein
MTDLEGGVGLLMSLLRLAGLIGLCKLQLERGTFVDEVHLRHLGKPPATYLRSIQMVGRLEQKLR